MNAYGSMLIAGANRRPSGSVFSARNDKPSLCRRALIAIALPNGKTMVY